MNPMQAQQQSAMAQQLRGMKNIPQAGNRPGGQGPLAVNQPSPKEDGWVNEPIFRNSVFGQLFGS
jgi:hypothetical protein